MAITIAAGGGRHGGYVTNLSAFNIFEIPLQPILKNSHYVA
jgi:hypothetical protein